MLANVAPALAAVPSERSFRGQGCSPACRLIRALIPGEFGRSELLLHDPVSHEAWGRAQSGEFGRGYHDVATGPLVVRLATVEAFVGGRLILPLATKEWHILRMCAEQIDRVVPYRDLVSAIWPYRDDTYKMDLADSQHLIRVNACRLRARLGPARGLLETRQGYGLLLRQVPPS